uniref:Uncharacterized protein n=1 Tax=Anguilla anguilla TaxID=7936 RepID=A0A0E9UYN4_ANGAN
MAFYVNSTFFERKCVPQTVIKYSV